MERDPSDRRPLSYYLKPAWLAGCILVLFVIGLFLYAEFVYVFFVFTRWLDTLPALGISLFIIWHFTWITMAVSYVRCVLTDPGSVPIEVKQFNSFFFQYIFS